MDGSVERKSYSRAFREYPLTLALTSLSDVINQLQDISQRFRREQNEELREMVAECTRVKVVLEEINYTCGQIAPVEIEFITDINCIETPGAPSAASVLRLLHCIGMNRRWRYLYCGNVKRDIFLPVSVLDYSASKLGQDIVERAKQKRLILVSHSFGGMVAEKALFGLCSSRNGDWLRSHIAGIISLDGSELLSPADQFSNFGFPKNSSWKHTVGIVPDHACTTISIHYAYNPHLSEQIPGNFTRRSHFGGLNAPMIPQTRNMEVWCDVEDVPDCTSWSILRLLAGEQGSQLDHNPRSLSLSSGVLLEHQNWRPAYSLERALGANGLGKAKIILKALRWVAFALRLLDVDELFSAVVTVTAESDCYTKDLRDTNELVELCAYLLVVDKDNKVQFYDHSLRNLILSSERSTVDPCQHTQVHGMIATVCLRHLQCLHRQSIFRPWLLTGDWLCGKVQRCQFWSYSTSFWYEHFRIAEGDNQDLPGILYSILQSDLSEDKLQLGHGETISDLRINIGLWICSQYDFSILGKTFLEMGADVDYKHTVDGTPLHRAAANSSTNMFKLLLAAGADTDSLDQNGMTPLHHCSISGSLDAVCLLLDFGANVNVHPRTSGDSGSFAHLCDTTALHLATLHGHVNVVRVLLEAGSNLDATTRCKETPLHFAAEQGHFEIFRCLIESGADPEAETAASTTALDIAIEGRYDLIVNFLMDRGAKPRVIRGSAIECKLQQVKSLTLQHETQPSSRATSTCRSGRSCSNLHEEHRPTIQPTSHLHDDDWSLVDRISLKMEIDSWLCMMLS